MKAQGLFRSILILTDREAHARLDQAAVNKARPSKVMVLGSGESAAKYMRSNSVDLVLCDSELSDMDGVDWLRGIMAEQKFKGLPVIMVTTEARREKVLEAISLGCIGYILRPYNIKTFEKHLQLAHHVHNFGGTEEIHLEEARNLVDEGAFDDAIEEYEEILAYQEEAQKYYDLGCQYLIQNKWGKAIIAFKKAVKINELYAEAYKGLADAYKGKGDMESYSQFLEKAAEIHAEFDRFEEAKRLFIEIIQYDVKAPNPFNTLGVRLRKEGDYEGALRAYDQAVKLSPDDEHVYFNIARAHAFQGNAELAIKYLRLALELNPEFHEARLMYQEVARAKWVPTAAKGGKAGPAKGAVDTVLDS